MGTSEEECIRTLHDAAAELGESPSKAQYEELGYTPDSATIQRVLGGWNAAKEAADLETAPSTGSRIRSKPDDVELPDDTTWADLSVYQRWHYRNREWNTERSLQRRQSLRRWLYDHKADREGCRRCDESDPLRLDFHHPNSDAKELAVNDMVTMGYSKADICAEAEKCVLLCANCHAREHATRSESAGNGRTKAERLRAWTTAYKRERGCGRCEESDPRCLQFHHVGEKRAGVGELIANSAPEETVREEVKRCEVLCANCHRATHLDPPEGVAESDSV